MDIRDFSTRILLKKDESKNVYDTLSDPRYYHVFQNIAAVSIDTLERDNISKTVWFHENKLEAIVVAKMTVAQTIIILAMHNMKKRIRIDKIARERYEHEEDSLIWEEVQKILEL